jgi:hypothetical protein
MQDLYMRALAVYCCPCHFGLLAPFWRLIDYLRKVDTTQNVCIWISYEIDRSLPGSTFNHRIPHKFSHFKVDYDNFAALLDPIAYINTNTFTLRGRAAPFSFDCAWFGEQNQLWDKGCDWSVIDSLNNEINVCWTPSPSLDRSRGS